ncbi:hypothetical protein [Tabrizicola sp.]|uniref:hypothetical protein n=1 Tax=Tabrizicola sp. TaxID=2005166 RepID=UPI003F321A9B
MKRILALCLLQQCVTIPVTAQVAGVVVELDNGVVMFGEAYADPYGEGVFAFVGGRLECYGYYDSYSQSRTLTVSFSCNRGVEGLASVVRSRDLQRGSGNIAFSNGWSGTVSFGY